MDNNLILTTEMFKEAEKYWRDNLSGELIEMDFPGDFSRTGQYEKESIRLSFREQTVEQLMHISKNNDFLLDVILLTIFKILIHKFTDQNDIIVSSSVLKTSNQNYNKCIALRDFLSPGMTFKQLLLKVKETAADGYKYQYYPIRKLIKLLKLENPLSLFKFIFLLENIHDKEFVKDITDNVENDIVFSVSKNEKLVGEITYNSKLYKKETIHRLYECYMQILEEVLRDKNIKIADINIISGDTKKKMLKDFNNTGIEYPKDKTLHQLFAEQAKQKRDHIVNVEINSLRPNGIRCISYGELNEKVNQLAIQLRNRGASPGSIISLMMGHSLDLMIGLLGILKAGCVYLPLDPDYPGERINYMLKDSSSCILLMSGDLIEMYDNIEFEGEFIEISSGGMVRTAEKESALLEYPTVPKDPAYVIYTSGSTGKPKGVLVEHRNVVRLVKNTNYIDFSEEDRMLPTGAISFDISTFEIWGPLLSGVQLYFVDEQIILDVEKLARVITQNGITVLHLIPQLFNQTAAQKIEIFAGLKYLLVGGDVVKPRYINEVRHRYKNLKILQMYGPTENTTFTTYFQVDKNYEINIPIGKPVANSTVYILDRFYKLQPPGIVGELCAGGDGIARGYLNSPGLTAEKFVPNPFIPGERLYKTGDLARCLPDGNIEFIGRRDNQVKIRGYRIELAEIERVLSGYEKIQEAITVTRSDEEENPYLCIYFTSGEEIEISELRKYLSQRLPDYMIPLFFVQLKEMPLTPNGKIERKVLPEPEIKASDEYAAPRNEVEEKLIEIWSNVLHIEKDVIGIDSNFFQLGGHSLKATLLAFAVHKELNIKITMNQVFKTPIVRDLAEHIKRSVKDRHLSIKPVEKKEYYKLSSAQKRLYILQEMYVENTLYNMPSAMVLSGTPDLVKLEETFKRLIARHETLRTSFHTVKDQPLQRIYDEVEFAFEYYNLTTEGTEEIQSRMEDFIRPFDLSCAPLLRVGLIKQEEKKYLMMVDMHHIIGDIISMGVVVREFPRLYKGSELPGLEIQYKDYAEWQNMLFQSHQIRQQEAYWLNRFKGKISGVNLPTDYPRPEKRSTQASRTNVVMEKEWNDALGKLAFQSGATLYMVLIAAVNVLISRYTEGEDIIVGFPIVGRPHPDLENVLGMFVNILPLRNFPRSGKTFKEFLGEVRKNLLDAYDNQDYQFEELVTKLKVKREPGKNPLFDFAFAMDEEDMGDMVLVSARDFEISFEADSYDFSTTRFDLTFFVRPVDSGLSCSVRYSSNLFKKETIERMIKNYKEILSQVAENPGIKLENLKISSHLIKADDLSDEGEVDFSF